MLWLHYKKELKMPLKSEGKNKKIKPGLILVSKQGSVANSQKKAIQKRGGTVTYKRDGKLPVGLY